MVQYMPKDTKYLTSVRDPAFQLRSAYQYFDAQRCLNQTYSEFLNNVNKISNFGKCEDYYKWWLINSQMFDLGLDTSNLKQSNFKDKQLVREKIGEIERRFSMVLVLERLDESLVVMRDLFNWTTEDITYLRLNFRVHKTEEPYRELERSLAREWDWADEMMYIHFYQKLDSTIKRHPEYYSQEVITLQHRCALWKSRCVKNVIQSSHNDNHLMHEREGVGTYALTSKGKLIDQCIKLTMGEVAKSRLLNAGRQINSQTFLQGEVLQAKADGH